jgi:hypothetical protein
VAEAVSALVCWLPETAFVPDQAPEAVHDVAFVVDQLSVDLAPAVMLVGFALNVTAGFGAAVVTATDALLEVVPPVPVHASV